MEHRYSQRAAAGTPVTVLKRGEAFTSGHVTDLSRRGLFIELDSEELVVNQTLEIEFQMPGSTDAKSNRFKAVIARITEKGIGVEFESMSKEEFDTIKTIVDESSASTTELLNQQRAKVPY